MQTDPLKDSIIAALHAFIRQRPGLEYGNYGDAAAYHAEIRGITRDLNHARQLLRQVELSHGITGHKMLGAATGRLIFRRKDSGVTVVYTAGQYFPTEYRKAVARFCAELLWAYRRDHAMPESVAASGEAWRFGGMSAGEWLRHSFRREYGRAIADRYFN